jgi:hypothetical protein
MISRKTFVHGLMGSPSRFAVMVWLNKSPWAYYSQTEVQRGTGILQGEVRIALGQLEKLGLLELNDAMPHRPKWRTVASPIWTLVPQLVAALDDMEAGRAEPKLSPTDAAGAEAPLQLPKATGPRRGRSGNR